jgi:hypothetical protein
MANEIRKISEVTLATSRPRSLHFHRNGLTLEMGEATIYEDRAPTEAQRADLKSHFDRLTEALKPSTSKPAHMALLAMLASMPSQALDTTDTKLRAVGYNMAIEDLPAWAIERAARRFVLGETPHGKTFAPTPAIFREFVLEMLTPYRAEMDLIGDILRAKVVPAPKDIYRLPRPGTLKWSDIQPEERIGHDPEPPIGKHITDDFMADLKTRMARRAATTEGENA